MDAEFDSASLRLRPIFEKRDLLTRAQYEADCLKNAVQILTNEMCTLYAVCYGECSFPEYDVEQAAMMHFAKRRLQSIDA